MDKSTCSLDECGKKVLALSFCSTHYHRFKKHGDARVGGLNRLSTEPCVVADCNRKRRTGEWCDKHYRRWLRHGDPQGSATRLPPATPVRRRCVLCSAELPVTRGPLKYCSNSCREASLPRCSALNCARSARDGGLCSAHAQRRRSGRDINAPLRPCRGRGSPQVRDELGRKLCPTCREWLAIAQFSSSVRTKDGLAAYCRDCSGLRIIPIKFGISIDHYRQILAVQGGRCAICRREPTGRKLAVDHDHRCCPGQKACGRCVRGLLCGACNSAIGLLKDDPEMLLRAAQYVASF